MSEQTEEPKISLVKVSIDIIDFNPYNPNIYTDRMLEGLKENIKRYGFIEPGVASKKEDGRYLILDGEHRVLAMKDLGFIEIPIIEVTSLRGLPEDIAPLMFNEVRGRISETRKRAIVLDAIQNYTKEELKRFSNLNLEKAGYSFRGDEEQLRRELDAAREINTVIKSEIQDVKTVELNELSRTLIITGFTMGEYKNVLKSLKDIDKNLKKSLLKLLSEHETRKSEI